MIRTNDRSYLSRGLRHAWAPALLCAAIGCISDEGESLGTYAGELASTNGLSTNGLSTNGLSTNGLSTNGLSTNGLSTNGLSTNGLSTNGLFTSWFAADPVETDLLMRYVARCALPASQSLSFTHGGTTYTWPGSLGLAPGWASNQPASLAEQQVVSACLAAHANEFGVNLNISVLGRGATGSVIEFTEEELETFSQREACFFGNLFTSDGLFAANDTGFLSPAESTARCGLSSGSGDLVCAPVITHVGACEDHCQLDASQLHYTSCTYNGTEYLPLNTRIQPQDIYRCGDGVCQVSEQCGTGVTPDSCAADCGAC